MISLGDIKVSELYLGSSPIAEAYLGDEKVYPEESPEPPSSMSVQELIDNGYATLQNDYAASSPIHGGTYNPGYNSESNYDVIQIHSNCPIALENITDFDTCLESAVTFVWRESLPAGWNASDLAAKYTNAELARPPMEEMFVGVDMGDVSDITLSFEPAAWYVCDTSILTRRNTPGMGCLPSPENVTITIRNGSDYSSVFQTSLSQLTTTKHITFNAGQGWGCHDVVGMFEYDYQLTGLTFTGRIYGWTSRWDGGELGMIAMFDNCRELIEVPLLNSDLPRDHEYNYLYPHRYSGDWWRGSDSINNMFRNCTALTSIKPTLYFLATSSGSSTNAFNCPNLTDVRIKGLNNSDYDFTDSNYYIPRMDVASIEYLLNNVSDQQATEQGLLKYWTDSGETEVTTEVTEYPVLNDFTITFNDLHQSEISQSCIDSAAAKGWHVAFNHVDIS